MTTATTLGSDRAPGDQASTAAPKSTLLGRSAVLLYGTAVYGLFLATFLYVIGFVAGAFVPKHLDSGQAAPLSEALLVNCALLGLFAVQHMIMARPAFKKRWTRIIPPAAERSTFVLTTCVVLGLMVWQWRPLPQTVWHVEGIGADMLWALCALGWGIVLASTWLIDHFELFGLKQVVRHFRGVTKPKTPFVERSLYRLVRHPLMSGFLIAFWATPHMSLGHLVFAVMCTGYILVGTRVEERDLIAEHGEQYLDYKRRVPSLVPLARRAS